ncbi:hypothetical protein RHGRI_036241 [Rhododendron griersonianum]|uniref:Tetratricopeptide repeat-like superfamily protein n=1 Tax=Rhododendron griersonianum TaxID=479676 RepID=A0AAV6HQ66_9ERIC|nr:hypothetical protein RHGRI_036241 [Rhododendron griersonianum]KAG5515133.1 hypothetical protein RHGRI_036241 [Rhododendron griersonianum]
MGVKVAAACLHQSQSPVPHPPSSPQTLVSTVSTPSLKRRSFNDGALVFRSITTLDRPVAFGSNLYRSKSTGRSKPRTKTITRAYSENLDAFSDEEFSKQIQELAMKFQLYNDDDSSSSSDTTNSTATESETSSDCVTELNGKIGFSPFEPLQPPEWSGTEEIIPASIERKANSVDIPLSLRIIKRKKKQLEEGFAETGDSACSSVKKAFSSMVFIIRELQSFTLQMREMLLYEDLQGILTRVQTEMNASFVWLFQQVFSHTPTLMISVMILLANYTVYSMSNATAIAAPPPSPAALMESVSAYEDQTHNNHKKFDSSAIKTFSVNGKTASIGGNNGGGGSFPRIASGTDGDGRFDETTSLDYGAASATGNPASTGDEESVSVSASAREEESRAWNAIVEEAGMMQGEVRDESLDQETVQRFVSPVTAKIEGDVDYPDYFRTELVYQTGLAEDPDNCVLLANYAQFLYLVAHEYDRAEEYFKRAVKVEPPDAEALSKYAGFLWQARKDLWAAEETYLEALSAEPTNSYYAANYAHFLWNTGGEDTCFPIDNTNEA